MWPAARRRTAASRSPPVAASAEATRRNCVALSSCCRPASSPTTACHSSCVMCAAVTGTDRQGRCGISSRGSSTALVIAHTRWSHALDVVAGLRGKFPVELHHDTEAGERCLADHRLPLLVALGRARRRGTDLRRVRAARPAAAAHGQCRPWSPARQNRPKALRGSRCPTGVRGRDGRRRRATTSRPGRAPAVAMPTARVASRRE